VRADVERAIAAIRAGGVVVIPTDTVYGLAASGESEEAARAVYRLKGRDEIQPTALLAASVDLLLARLPELPADVVRVVRALLPGPFTLVVPNPSGRYGWLTGASVASLGVRVPALGGAGAEVLDAVETLVATSANLPGGSDPRTLADVPVALRDGAGAIVDGGTLPGVPSTVLDLTGPEPVVLRRGAVPAARALSLCAQALSVGATRGEDGGGPSES
jgi:L-threonylcarbamoyladenylate synthase